MVIDAQDSDGLSVFGGAHANSMLSPAAVRLLISGA